MYNKMSRHTKMFENNKCLKCKTSVKFYDGLLGYEAVYCPKCGLFADHTTTGQDDNFIER